ncbi:nitrile hydratase accessory protein [Burkholderia sp. WAC0059]|uniref:nitrile hydratase accessory protein n=1 Tax=Burkholderia sp. WAC0059 TaxID=2066022 RepID=UPI000C7E982C|nr:nitrile hydratase accessory protein [Burkholderia sp. WAC0059]PLZ00629.1 nitrile hydratase accessory protein [Burkholderia sp. WAC0059]
MQPADVLACDSLADLRHLETLSFPTPWSARAFGIVLAAAERGLFSLREFQQALIVEIGAYERQGGPIDGDETYYSRWVAALTTLLDAKGLVSPPGLQAAEQGVRGAFMAAHSHAHGEGEPQPVCRDGGQ